MSGEVRKPVDVEGVHIGLTVAPARSTDAGVRDTRTPPRHFALLAVGVALGLFLVMLSLLEVGRQFGIEQLATMGKDARVGVGVVDGAVYGLLALLIGFMFSGAATRFDQRRQLVAEEANAAGTAWQRIDLLPAEQQIVVRDGLRRYVDTLVAWYGEAPGYTQAVTEPPPVTEAQNAVWSSSVSACLSPGGEVARMLLLPALNDLFGAVERERAARRIHPPVAIFGMLGVALVASAMFAGYGLAAGPRRPWLYMLGIAAAISVATYVILELEYPRLGLVRVNHMDRALAELRATM